MVCLMDSVLATHVREVDLLKEQQGENYVHAFNQGKQSNKGQVLKMQKKVEDSKAVEEGLNQHI